MSVNSDMQKSHMAAGSDDSGGGMSLKMTAVVGDTDMYGR